ncbi:MAG: hypothetical protein HY736_09175 [Verrucomicrobia bacterium]|nr:hypothetical protein [Verrucomicrobiota bacterium]
MDDLDLTILVRDLKGFRHVVRHAYDLTLRPHRLSELAVDANRIATSFPDWTAAFAAAVRREQGWPQPGS